MAESMRCESHATTVSLIIPPKPLLFQKPLRTKV